MPQGAGLWVPPPLIPGNLATDQSQNIVTARPHGVHARVHVWCPAPPHPPWPGPADEATDVTFNLKDFKAMLSLCESLGTHIRLWFDSPGNPLVAEPCFSGGAHGQVGPAARSLVHPLHDLWSCHSLRRVARPLSQLGSKESVFGRTISAAAAWPHTQRPLLPPSSCPQDVDYEAELILSTLMESHAGAAAAAAAAAAAGRAANGGGDELRTPAGGVAAGLGMDSPAGDGVPSTGRGAGPNRAAELGFSPAPGLPVRTFAGAAVARPGSAGAAGAAGEARVGLPGQGQLPSRTLRWAAAQLLAAACGLW